MSDLSDYKRLVEKPYRERVTKWLKERDTRINELESALRRYGRHEDGCVLITLRDGITKQCTCGLSEALGQPGGEGGSVG